MSLIPCPACGQMHDKGQTCSGKPSMASVVQAFRDVAAEMKRLEALVVRLRAAEPAEFVQLVRLEIRKPSGLSLLCAAAGAKYGAGVSLTRAIGNLSEALHGRNRRNEYLAAFFDEKSLVEEPDLRQAELVPCPERWPEFCRWFASADTQRPPSWAFSKAPAWLLVEFQSWMTKPPFPQNSPTPPAPATIRA